MERALIIDNYNTYNDWRLILTAKSVTPPQAKTKYVNLDGMNGTLDLSEALSGEIMYNDRTITASFLLTDGTFLERNIALQNIINKIHGKKLQIIDPDYPKRYFLGRVSVKSFKNILPYAEMSIEAVCEPWRYAIHDIARKVDVDGQSVDIIITNNGAKTLCPEITVTGSIEITFGDNHVALTDGSYKISELKLYHGITLIKANGTGSVVFTYREADL